MTKSLRAPQFVAVAGYLRGWRSGRVQLSGGQQRIEALCPQVVEADGVTTTLKRSASGEGDGVVEAAPVRMGKNNRDFHGQEKA